VKKRGKLEALQRTCSEQATVPDREAYHHTAKSSIIQISQSQGSSHSEVNKNRIREN